MDAMLRRKDSLKKYHLGKVVNFTRGELDTPMKLNISTPWLQLDYTQA